MNPLPIRQLKKYLNDNYSGVISISDVSGNLEERENSFLSRAIALHALVLETQIEPKLLREWIVDGYQDNGIDAMYYDENLKLLYLVQAKWHNDGRGSIDVGSTLKFIKGVKAVLNTNFSHFNEKVKKKQAILRAAIDNPSLKISIVTVYSGKDKLSTDVISCINEYLVELNDFSEIISHKNIDLQLLHASLIDKNRNASIQEEIVLYGWGSIKEPYHAVYGQLAAIDAANWYKKYSSRLFSKNIRSFLGMKDANEEIEFTLLNNSDLFWYFNNGITILAESIEKRPIGGNTHDTGYFVCNGMQIVNGAQTVGSIDSAFTKNPIEVEKAFVHVRIISLDKANEDFEKNVTRTNNTQTKIDSRDFVALDPVQQQIKDVLAIDGIDYVYKQGDPIFDKSTSFDFIEATLARVYSVGSVEMSVVAKAQLGKFWSNIEKEPYKFLFNEGMVNTKLWYDVEALRMIDMELNEIQKKNIGRARLIAIHGNRAIAFSVFRNIGLSNNQSPISETLKSSIKLKTNEVFDALIRLTDKIFPDSYPANLFKNTAKTKQLIDIVIANN